MYVCSTHKYNMNGFLTHSYIQCMYVCVYIYIHIILFNDILLRKNITRAKHNTQNEMKSHQIETNQLPNEIERDLFLF